MVQPGLVGLLWVRICRSDRTSASTCVDAGFLSELLNTTTPLLYTPTTQHQAEGQDALSVPCTGFLPDAGTGATFILGGSGSARL